MQFMLKSFNLFKSVLSVGLVYRIIVTLRVSEGRKLILLVLIFHPVVLHFLFNNGLKEILVDCIKTLRTKTGK